MGALNEGSVVVVLVAAFIMFMVKATVCVGGFDPLYVPYSNWQNDAYYRPPNDAEF
jgi:hypothetical protein